MHRNFIATLVATVTMLGTGVVHAAVPMPLTQKDLGTENFVRLNCRYLGTLAYEAALMRDAGHTQAQAVRSMINHPLRFLVLDLTPIIPNVAQDVFVESRQLTPIRLQTMWALSCINTVPTTP